jgi:hypothetical protein
MRRRKHSCSSVYSKVARLASMVAHRMPADPRHEAAGAWDPGPNIAGLEEKGSLGKQHKPDPRLSFGLERHPPPIAPQRGGSSSSLPWIVRQVTSTSAPRSGASRFALGAHQVPAHSRRKTAGIRETRRIKGGLEERRCYWEGRGNLTWGGGRQILGLSVTRPPRTLSEGEKKKLELGLRYDEGQGRRKAARRETGCRVSCS